MTRSTETPAVIPRLGPDWRRAALAAQDAGLPTGSVALSCPAPFGAGGLGRHLQELADALERAGRTHSIVCEPGPAGPPPPPRLRRSWARPRARALAPAARRSAAWRILAASIAFDGYACERLPAAEDLLAFNGTALAQFRLAARLGYRSRSLVAANSHFRHVLAQHERAHRQYPLEAPWPRHLLHRNLREYELADRIYVASRYVRESFLERGVPDERLADFPLTPDPRFGPAPVAAERSGHSSTFDVVYVGALTVHKGVALLVEAFRRLPGADMRLILVGGWKSRGMRRFIERTCAQDARVAVRPGDPLPLLRRAALCVHAAYEDGFAYAPAEALACGVPVIVSEDTGMKELIEVCGGGAILATGERGALSEAIEAAYQGHGPGG